MLEYTKYLEGEKRGIVNRRRILMGRTQNEKDMES